MFAASSEAIADSLLSFFSEMNCADPAVSVEIIVFKLLSEINFWHPFRNFEGSPLPNSLAEYYAYKEIVMEFVDRVWRLHRIFRLKCCNKMSLN